MNITIIGGGITGLTTALGLHKLGIPCKIYERTPQLAPVGAGIVMSPNAMKVFKWLGIDQQVAEAGVALKNGVVTCQQLVPLRKPKEDFLKDESNQFMVALHRAALHEILVKNVPAGTLELGHELHHLENTSGGVKLIFNNLEVKTDIVLGADGLHSKTRSAIFPHSKIRYSGQTCWRGVSTHPIPDALKNSSTEAWGWKRRFGFVNIGKDMIYWFAVISAPDNFKPVEKNINRYLKEQFRSFHPSVIGIIDQTEPDHIIQNDIDDLERLSCWHKGNICLTGDAAHATTPNMGQGGAQGVEDAYYICQTIKKYDNPQQAFKSFEKIRRKKVDKVVNTSWTMGKMIHNSIQQPLLKLILKSMSDKSVTSQMRNIYHIDPPMV